MITIPLIEVKIELTPEQLAEEFCNMSSKEQAAFFETISEITDTWEYSFAMQLQYISSEPDLTEKGRSIMKLIGDYS